MAEFTGERVIPGAVEPDLWNEHRARYLFAARLAAGRRVLDAGCGSGYGAAGLAALARCVVGVDVAQEAIDYARTNYARGNLEFFQASCTALPFAEASFDLIVCFEVIEHLGDWPALLKEVRRVLAPGGHFVLSTPNERYYAESRKLTGPNPYHSHEFSFDEFSGVLRVLFPRVTLYVQNHVDGIVFQRVGGDGGIELQAEPCEADPAGSHFFVAVCGGTDPASLLYLPRAANVLRERELHIERLERELAMKNEWLEKAQQDHQALLDLHRSQAADLEARTHWAGELDVKLRLAGERIAALEEHLTSLTAGYERKIAELELESRQTSEWAQATEKRLSAELAESARLLEQAEKTFEERTNWALKLEAQVRELEAQLNAVRASRWFRYGRAVGLGPALRDS